MPSVLSRRRSRTRALGAAAVGVVAAGLLVAPSVPGAAAADPSLVERPQAVGLGAAAALLAQRLDRAAPLLDPKLNGTQEVELWRALLQVERGEAAPGDAASMAAALPILLAYPQP